MYTTRWPLSDFKTMTAACTHVGRTIFIYTNYNIIYKLLYIVYTYSGKWPVDGTGGNGICGEGMIGKCERLLRSAD